MKKGLISSTLLLLCTVTALLSGINSAIADEQSQGQDYVVQKGDGLYSLGRKFFGKGIAYKRIVTANNAKAATDSRYGVIDANKGLKVGQLIWIPSGGATVVNKTSAPKPAEPSVTERKLASEIAVPSSTPSVKPPIDDAALPKSDQATIVSVPIDDCQIRIWYNYQIVAIARINQRWKENGINLMERAKRAFTIRHRARINGRYMMADKFEAAALRDRDNKKYGNPDGPTFAHLVAFTREKGFEGDDIYKAIIESSSKTSPVFNSSCEK